MVHSPPGPALICDLLSIVIDKCDDEILHHTVYSYFDPLETFENKKQKEPSSQIAFFK